MNTKTNYFKVGLFFIVASGMILGAVVVLGAGVFTKKKAYFETYFAENVSGLNVGSDVEIRGVRIGRVEKIAFACDEYKPEHDHSTPSESENYVMVLCSLSGGKLPDGLQGHDVTRLKGMISRGLRLQIESNILTGQSFLQGDYMDIKRFPLLEIDWTPKNLYIPSAPSTFLTLKDSVDQVLQRLQEIDVNELVVTMEDVLESFETAIVDANIGGISKGINSFLSKAELKLEAVDTEALSAAAERALNLIGDAIAEANVPGLSREAQNVFANLDKVLGGTVETSGKNNIPMMIAQFNKTLARLDKLIVSKEPGIAAILANFKEISENIRDLTESLKRHPVDLLLSKPPEKSEAFK